MSNFFTKKYCDDVFELSQMRKSPLTNDELKEILPYKEDRDKYFDFLRELYKESLLFQVHYGSRKFPTEEYTRQLRKIFMDLLDFCLLKGMIDRESYFDFGGGQKEWDKKYFPLGELRVKIFTRQAFAFINQLETLEEYSLRIEEFLASFDYLNLRYDDIICFSASDEKTLYYYDFDKDTISVADNKRIMLLWEQINSDISNLKSEISSLESITRTDIFDSQIYNKQLEAFKRIRELHKELLCLYNGLENIVEPHYNRIKEFEKNICNKSEILYIYKGSIKCHRQNHTIIQATAICYDSDDKEIPLNVEYCSECKKYFLEYGLFERYKTSFKILIGNFRMTNDDGTFISDYDLALESPLKLSGYSVSQKDGLSSGTRQHLLARIIYNNIMSKGEVIKYLSYFIRMQGSKYGNEIALQKWEEDLEFVQNYNKEFQPKIYISKFQKY